MRILFLNSWRSGSAEGSGTAVGIANLASALEGLGHTVEIARPGDERGSLASRLLFNLALPRRLRSSSLPDLVLGFDIDGFRWAPCERRMHTPYIVSLKGIAADEARFARSRVEALELRGLARLERLNARAADLVLVPSAYSARVAAERYEIPAERIRVVPEAIDLERLSRMRDEVSAVQELDPEPPPDRRTTREGGIILTVARQYPRKDTATLLRALPRVLESRPGTRLRVIGGGPELPRLRRLVRELALENVVALEGAVPEAATVQRAYLDADVFCLPSLQEGFGIAFIEAMSAALPVVAARAGAVPEVVSHERTGLLVPPRDEAALAGALLRLLDRPEERRALGRAGAAVAREFGLEAVGRRFLETVRPLLESATPPPRSSVGGRR